MALALAGGENGISSSENARRALRNRAINLTVLIPKINMFNQRQALRRRESATHGFRHF
jgi:hypothetical protein